MCIIGGTIGIILAGIVMQMKENAVMEVTKAVNNNGVKA